MANERMKIPVVKAKGEFVEFDLATLPDHIYRAAIELGLKQMVNGGTTKITKSLYPKPEELKAAAMAKAEERAEDIRQGKIRLSTTGAAASAGKVDRDTMTEARRIAKGIIKTRMVKAGKKISHVDPSEITKAANALIAQNPAIVEQARAEIERRQQVDVGDDIVSSIAVSDKRVAKANKVKEDRKAEVSAAKAGQTVVKTKGKGQKVPPPKTVVHQQPATSH
jgi:hypothetical protein